MIISMGNIVSARTFQVFGGVFSVVLLFINADHEILARVEQASLL